MTDFETRAMEAKQASFAMAVLPTEVKNKALLKVADALIANKEAIFSANEIDLKNAKETDLPMPLQKRLVFDDHKLNDVVSGLKSLTELPDPVGRELMKTELDDDLILTRVSCPIGVIGVFFESRPDALVQISALCIKSGNCAILKGGSEAKKSNRKLFDVIYEAGVSAGLPEGFAMLVESHEGVGELLECNDSIDLVIPRGSNAFVQYIMNNTRIPVMGHADGICTVYVDKDADIDKSAKIIADAKEQYVSACKAAEVILVHESVDREELIKKVLAAAENDIEVNVDGEYKEYLDLALTVRTVADVDEAISLINRNGSHHTDAIMTENEETAEHFMDYVDSAGVYHNCSTRFADGFRYGFGAEVGISTSKIHARGPVGLEGLVTYKYKLYGHGQIVGDYASGKSEFHFKDL